MDLFGCWDFRAFMMWRVPSQSNVVHSYDSESPWPVYVWIFFPGSPKRNTKLGKQALKKVNVLPLKSYSLFHWHFSDQFPFYLKKLPCYKDLQCCADYRHNNTFIAIQPISSFCCYCHQINVPCGQLTKLFVSYFEKCVHFELLSEHVLDFIRISNWHD